jgi:hypothetical protein
MTKKGSVGSDTSRKFCQNAAGRPARGVRYHKSETDAIGAGDWTRGVRHLTGR